MKIEEAITLFGYHQRSNQKTRTIQSYRPLLRKIQGQFAGRSFDSIGPDEIYRFLEPLPKARRSPLGACALLNLKPSTTS
jgi:hypothetical protein